MKKTEEKKINLDSIELEDELLGCYLDDPDQCRADEDGIKPYLFVNSLNRKIGEIIQKNIKNQRKNTYALILTELNNMFPDKKDAIKKHVNSLIKIKTHPENIPDIIAELQALARRRKLKEVGVKLTEISEREENITDQANKIFDEFNFLGEEKKIYDFYELTGRYAENYEERKNKGQPLGFPKLDAHINGVKGGQLAVVAAGTGVGKTTFALTSALNFTKFLAMQGRETGALIYSVEMNEMEIMDKLLSIATRIDIDKITHGDLSDKELTAINQVRNEFIYDLNIKIVSENINIDTILRTAKSCMRTNPYRLLIVDYIQILDETGDDLKMQRYLQIGRWSRKLKQLAKELNITVMILSQLNKDNKLRESENIGQDADIVIKLSKDKDADHIINLYLEKARHAPSGFTCNLNHLGNISTFSEIDYEYTPKKTDSGKNHLDDILESSELDWSF